MSGESTATASTTNQSSGPPNRPLPPTPDDDAQGDRTLIMKRVSDSCNFFIKSTFYYFFIFQKKYFFTTYIHIFLSLTVLFSMCLLNVHFIIHNKPKKMLGEFFYSFIMSQL